MAYHRPVSCSFSLYIYYPDLEAPDLLPGSACALLVVKLQCVQVEIQGPAGLKEAHPCYQVGLRRCLWTIWNLEPIAIVIMTATCGRLTDHG